jgi:hypothetical protein
MRDGTNRRAASIIAAGLAVALAAAVQLLAPEHRAGSRHESDLNGLRLQKAEASLAPETLSRP